MEAAVGIHASAGDEVEALRSLAVALLLLGAERARPGADGVSAEQFEAGRRRGILLHPDLELVGFLVNAQVDGCSETKAFFLQRFLQGGANAGGGRSGSVGVGMGGAPRAEQADGRGDNESRQQQHGQPPV